MSATAAELSRWDASCRYLDSWVCYGGEWLTIGQLYAMIGIDRADIWLAGYTRTHELLTTRPEGATWHRGPDLIAPKTDASAYPSTEGATTCGK